MIQRLLYMSAMGTVAVCAVCLVRFCLRRMPKIFSYALWFVVLFRLLCPVSVPMPISVYQLFSASAAGTQGNTVDHQAVLENDRLKSTGITGPMVKNGSGQTQPERSMAASGQNRADRMWNLFFVIWLCGVGVFAVFTGADLFCLSKKIKYARLEREPIYLLDKITSPFVAGILHPRIYLPYGLSEQERTYILYHEQTHIRRKDPLFRALFYLALVLHWFNPFVWAAFFLSGRDMEMSCDEQVLRGLGMEIKCDYSQSMLEMAQGKRKVPIRSLSFGKNNIKKRIQHVLHYKRVSKQALFVSVLVVVLTIAVLGTDPVSRVATAARLANTQQTAVRQDSSIQAGGGRTGGAEKTDSDPAGTQHAAALDAGGAAVPKERDTRSAIISVRSVSSSARCIDRYVAPDDTWEETYGDEIAFSKDCRFFINDRRDTLDARSVSFRAFAKAIAKGDAYQNKPCLIEIDEKKRQIQSITLISGRYQKGVSYAWISGTFETDAVLNKRYDKYHAVRMESMDIASAPGEETVQIYEWQESGCAFGEAVVQDSAGNPFWSFEVSEQGMCQCNLYAGRMDGSKEPFLLEVHLENRDTYGEYSYYMYTLDAQNGTYVQSKGCSIEWAKDSSLLYEADEMMKFFHLLEHYLHDSHLLVGLEMREGQLRLRTEPDCDENRYTYENCAPDCFMDL